MASNKFSQISFKSNQVRFSVDDVKSFKTPTHPSNNISSREIPNMAFINTLIDNKIAASGGGGGGSNYSPDLTKQVDVVHATSSQLYLNGPGEGEAYTKIVLNEALYLEEYQENEVNAISTPLTSGSDPNYNRFVVGTNNFYNPQYLFTTNGNPLIGSGVMNNYGQSYAILEDPTDNNYVFMATDVHPGVYRYNLTTAEQTQLTGANGNGLNGTVRCLAWDWDSYSLICGGDFTATTGGNLPVLKVAKYNGTDWSSIDGLGGSGISGESVNAICVVNNYGSTKYFFGGSFVGAYDGTSVTNSPNLTCYDTTDGWVSINGGAGIDNGAVLALANDTNNDMLLVGGTFSTIPINGSDTSANCFTRWSYSDNEFNLDVGYFTGTSVNCIYYDNVNTNAFFIGGAFTHAGVGNNNYFDPVESNCIVQYNQYDNEFHTNDMKICVKARSNDNSTQVVRGISTIYYEQYDTYYLVFGGHFSGYVSLNNLSGDTISKNNFIIIPMNNFNYRLTIHDNNTDEDIFYTTKYYDSATLTWDSINGRWTLLETTRLQNDLSYPETGDYQKLVTVNYVNNAISAEIYNNVNPLQSTIYDLSNNVTNLSTKVTDLSNNVSGKTTQINDLSNNLHSLQVQVDNLPAGISVDDTVNNFVNMGYNVYPNFAKEWRELINYSGANCLGMTCSGNGKVAMVQGWGAACRLTTDFGASWTLLSSLNYAWSAAMSLDGQYIAVTESNNFWLSTDYGKTFNVPTNRPNWANVVAVSATGKYMICGSTGGASGIYVSSDYSQSAWTQSNSGVNWNAVAISPDGSIMLAGNASGVVKKSTNYGQTWSTIYTDSGSTNIKHIKCSEDGQIILIALDTSSKLKLSTDGGATFSDVANTQSYYAISMNASGLYMIASYSNVLDYSVDKGVTWTTISNSRIWMSCMSFSGEIMYAVTTYNKPLISRSSTASVMALTEPTIASAGSTYFDTSSNKIFVYNGTAWKYAALT